MQSVSEAKALFAQAWPLIVEECRAVLGGELHYQAVIYHCLRQTGAPRRQIGMNVRQWIVAPVTSLFQAKDLRKNVAYRGGFEPIPDVVLFRLEINGDWRRRNQAETLRHMLLAIEIKASERDKGRLGLTEIVRDIEKLVAHRDEVRHRGGDMHPVMVVIDTAPLGKERMSAAALATVTQTAEQHSASFFYVSPDTIYPPLATGEAGAVLGIK